MQELRREFHETNMMPLFRMIEEALYDQVHVREFGIRGWVFSFNSPDFLNAVERATVHMRYQQMGAMNANEIRYEIGQPKRTDENGDKYADQLAQEKAKASQPQNPQGSPPEGRADNPDSPSNTGEPTLDNQDPPRGDQHDNQTQRVLDALRKYRTVSIRRMSGRKAQRPYSDPDIPNYLTDAIHDNLLPCNNVLDVKAVFDEVFDLLQKPEQIQ